LKAFKNNLPVGLRKYISDVFGAVASLLKGMRMTGYYLLIARRSSLKIIQTRRT
jgi:hypothetical protein